MFTFLTGKRCGNILCEGPVVIVQAYKYLLEQFPNSPTRDQVQAFSKAVKVSFGLTFTKKSLSG